MRSRNPLLRLLRIVGTLLLVAIAAACGAVAWLYLAPPQPRAAEGWALDPPLPFARGELATAVAWAEPCPAPPCPQAERLVVVGGLAGSVRVEVAVSIYDPNTRQWSAGPPLPEPRHHLAAAGLGTAVYVSGGAAALSGWEPTDDLWRLELGAAEWQRLEPMPEPRFGHRMVAHDGRLYVVGGHGPSSRVLIYTPGEGWRSGAAMPVQRDHLSLVVAGGRLWAIGGRAPQSLDRVDIYDPAADAWQPGPPLPAPTSGAAEGNGAGVIFVFGGEEPRLLGGIVDRHWMLDTKAPSPAWQPAPPPPLAVHGADGAAFRGSVVIAGGASRHGLLSPTAWSDAVQRLVAPPAAQ
jgi:hypothetical protein